MKLIKKIIAPNPSFFTGDGTNTYLIGRKDITLIDPGPNISKHIDEIIIEGENNIKRILVTHSHKDHSSAARPLADKLNIPLMGMKAKNNYLNNDVTFYPNKELKDGDLMHTNEYSIQVIHTPGHASNHLSFLIKNEDCLIVGDHLMNGSTVVISPPDGDMRDYIISLKKLMNYKIKILAPGHGDYINNPTDNINLIIQHRLNREFKILEKLKDKRSKNIKKLVEDVYDDVSPSLHSIAIMSLEAHLIKLNDDKKILFENEMCKLIE